MPGGIYHVTLRGNNRRRLFSSPADRVHLNQLVGRATARLQARVHAFCWMTNHLHLAVQVAEQPLGRLMQWIGSRYAYYYNRQQRQTGHLFERRYHAILVDADVYLLELVRYIHRNPVKAKIVKEPAAYSWSSHRYYLGHGSLNWLETDWVLSLFAAKPRQARKAFNQFVVDPNAIDPPDELLRGSEEDGRLAGGNELLEELFQTEYVPPSLLTLETLITEHCACHGVTATALAGPSRQHHLSRIRAEITDQASRAGIATLAELSRRFNRSQVAIYRALQRYRQRQ